MRGNAALCYAECQIQVQNKRANLVRVGLPTSLTLSTPLPWAVLLAELLVLKIQLLPIASLRTDLTIQQQTQYTKWSAAEVDEVEKAPRRESEGGLTSHFPNNWS
jgi:hypothetical protein